MSTDHIPTARELVTVRKAALVFARAQMRKRGWHKLGPGGTSEEDYVQRAFEQFYSKERVWRPEKCTFLMYILGSIRSTISNASSSLEGKSAAVPYDKVDAPQLRIASDVIEEILDRKKVRDEILASCNDDMIMMKLAELILDEDITEAKDLSIRMGVPISVVTGIKKKLFHHIRKRMKNPLNTSRQHSAREGA